MELIKQTNTSIRFSNILTLLPKDPIHLNRLILLKKDIDVVYAVSDSIYYKINNAVVEIMAIVGRQDINNIL